MTSNKYIVKKCPCIKTTEYYLRDELITERICTSNREEFRLCQNRTDCVIKQVIDRCKKEQYIDKQHFFEKPSKDVLANFSKEILDVFEIEEINK